MSEALQTIEVTTSDRHALGFLKLLDPTTNQFCFRTFDDVFIEAEGGKWVRRKDKSLTCNINGSLKETLPQLRALNSKGAGVYVVINAGGHNTGAITSVRALFADTDGAPLEPLLVLKPHMVVESSKNKWHVYWLVDNCELGQFTAIQKAIAHKYGTDPSVKDLPRVMRLAGFNHNKYGAYPSTIITYNPDLPTYKVDEVLSGLGIEIDDSVSLTEQQRSNEIAKLGSLFNFPLEKLGSDRSATTETYSFTPENAIEFLSLAKAAYPNGLPDRPTYFELGMALAELVEVHGWPKNEARKILDDVGSKPTGANKDNNDSEWGNYLAGTRTKIEQGEAVTGHRSVFAKARANGWKPTSKLTDALSAVQDKFALISLGGKVGIVDKQELAATNTDGTAARLVVMGRMDGGLLVQRYVSSEFPQVDSKNTLSTFTHSKDTTLFNGVEFNPRFTTPNVLNLWVGMTLTPQAGSWSLIKTLLLEVICGGRQSEYEYLIKYIAHALQRPWEKPGVMVILLGGQGIGKGTLAKILQKIWSATFLQVNRIKQVVGDFNGSLERAYIVFLDEALFAGDRSSSDALKSLVTEPTLSINEKHQPARQITSYHRFFSATNAEHFKSTDRDDRRDFVLRVSEHRKGDHGYWQDLNHEIENGGVEAFTHELMHLDLSGFNVRAKPNTRELTEQKLQSLDKFPRWWFDCLSQARITNHFTEWPEFISSASLLGAFKESEKTIRNFKPVIDRDAVALMSKLCPSARREQSMEGKNRRRGYILPTVEAAREDFEKYIGDRVEWEVL